MRRATLLLFAAFSAQAQFRSTTPLVVAPTTVTDSKGRYVDGLTAQDLILYDNNVPQPIQMDWTEYPISLVVAVQTSANSGPVIEKLGGSGILFSQALAAGSGETAVLSFSDTVRVHQEFTADPDPVTHALRMLRMEGGNAHMLDALDRALDLLSAQPAGRRRIVLMIAEKRDRGSTAKAAEVLARAERLNAVVYWLTWSPFLTPFTVRAKTVEDLKLEAERIKIQQCITCPTPDDRAAAETLGPGGWIYALRELARLHQENLPDLFTAATGGRALGFVKKGALEKAVQLVGEEVHRQYILSFQPKAAEPGAFHRIRVAVKGRPELEVRAREGYWNVE